MISIVRLIILCLDEDDICRCGDNEDFLKSEMIDLSFEVG